MNIIQFGKFLYIDVFPGGQSEYESWFKGLKQGTVVDAMKLGDEVYIKKIWSKARVLEILDNNRV